MGCFGGGGGGVECAEVLCYRGGGDRISAYVQVNRQPIAATPSPPSSPRSDRRFSASCSGAGPLWRDTLVRDGFPVLAAGRHVLGVAGVFGITPCIWID